MDKYVTRIDGSQGPAKRLAEEQVDWRKPKKTFKLKPSVLDPQLQVNNRFSPLSTGDSQDAFQFSPSATAGSKVNKVPPIYLEIKEGWTHPTITSLISKSSNCFHLKYINKKKVAVYCTKPDEHEALKEGLRSENVSFYTYTRKDERPYKVIIRGLPENMENIICEEIKSKGFNVTNLKMIKGNISTDKIFSPLYIAELPVGSDITKFRQINRLCHCVVKMEKYKPKNNLGTQCYRCQRFGHASRNCNLPPRCVKCGLEHSSKDCPKDKSTPASCCNCTEDHPASYSKCKERLTYITNMQRNIIYHQKTSSLKVDPTIQPRIEPKRKQNPGSKSQYASWAEIAATQPVFNIVPDSSYVEHPPALKPTTEPQAIGNTPDEATAEIIHILSQIKLIKHKFLKCNNLMDKVLLILNHLGNYV